ncbi:methyltransferase domain-containing protein [Putridiphycobacter roseus]|nr:methyltransferase domain-containing protein [Putridiphycobacter roseus]
MSKDFWENRWENNQIGWDLGEVSPPIKAFIDQLNNKKSFILVPGCGNAYEAEYLFENGFQNTYIVEIADAAIQSFKKRYPQFPAAHIIHGDFFDLDRKFDLIIEQTFFCAIPPAQRLDYVKKVKSILNPKGKLVGLLFNRFFVKGPPYGGTVAEYESYFEKDFEIQIMEPAKNSIEPRDGSELFIKLQLK